MLLSLLSSSVLSSPISQQPNTQGKSFQWAWQIPKWAVAINAEGILFPTRVSSVICSTAYKIPQLWWPRKVRVFILNSPSACPLPFLQVILFHPTACLLSATTLYAGSASLNSKFTGQGKTQTAMKVILMWTFPWLFLPQWGPLWPVGSFLLRRLQWLLYSRLVILI